METVKVGGVMTRRAAWPAGRKDGVVNSRPRLRNIVTAAVIAAWLATLIVPPALLLQARSGWLEQLERPEAQAGWDAFRRDMRRQSGRDGPVQRKVPKSVEPPARVWLRDYFQLAVMAWVLFVGVLGGFFCLLVAGMAGRGRGPSLTQQQARRQHDDDQQHERDAENTEE
jgi:hypothetical protein